MAEKLGKKQRSQTEAKSNKAGGTSIKLKAKEYERELAKLHTELVKLQEWTKATGAKICIVFEGRDGAR